MFSDSDEEEAAKKERKEKKKSEKNKVKTASKVSISWKPGVCIVALPIF